MIFPGDTNFAIGTNQYPLPTSTGNTSLFDGDKVLYYMLNYIEQNLTYYIGARFVQECQNAGISSLDGTFDGYRAVGSALPYNPVAYLGDTGFNFPLLACWRGDGTMNEADISEHHKMTTLHLLYLFPPMKASNTEVLSPFLNAALDVIWDRIEHGPNPAVNDGYQIATLAGYEAIGVKRHERLQITVPGLKTNLPFESLHLEILVKEINTQPLDQDYVTVSGIDFHETLLNNDGYASIPDFVDGQSTP